MNQLPRPGTLQATNYGYMVHHYLEPGSIEARVRGVYRRACNLTTPGGQLITLIDQLHRGPTNIVVPGLRSALDRVVPGEPAQFSSSTLVLLRSGLTVDLGTAGVWNGPSLPEATLVDMKACRANVRAAAGIAAESGSTQSMLGFPGELDAEAGPVELHSTPVGQATPIRNKVAYQLRAAVQGLCQTARLRDVAGTLAHAQRLIGLGPGLTPSGDDFMSGFLLTLHFARLAAGQSTDWLDKVSVGVASLAAGRTTLVGSNQLRLAAQGEADEVTGQSAIAVLWGVPVLRAPVEALLDVGSSSGSDLLVGICAAADLMPSVMPHACA